MSEEEDAEQFRYSEAAGDSFVVLDRSLASATRSECTVECETSRQLGPHASVGFDASAALDGDGQLGPHASVGFDASAALDGDGGLASSRSVPTANILSNGDSAKHSGATHVALDDDAALLDVTLPPSVLEKVQFLASQNELLRTSLRRTNELLREKLTECESAKQGIGHSESTNEIILQLRQQLHAAERQLQSSLTLQSRTQKELDVERVRSQQLTDVVKALNLKLSNGGADSGLKSAPDTSSEVDGLLRREQVAPFGSESPHLAKRLQAKDGDDDDDNDDDDDDVCSKHDVMRMTASEREQWEVVDQSLRAQSQTQSSRQHSEQCADVAEAFLEGQGVGTGGGRVDSGVDSSSSSTTATNTTANTTTTTTNTTANTTTATNTTANTTTTASTVSNVMATATAAAISTETGTTGRTSNVQVENMARKLAQQSETITNLHEQYEDLRTTLDECREQNLSKRQELSTLLSDVSAERDKTTQRLLAVEGENATLAENYEKMLQQVEATTKLKDKLKEDLRQSKLNAEMVNERMKRLLEENVSAQDQHKHIEDLEAQVEMKNKQLDFFVAQLKALEPVQVQQDAVQGQQGPGQGQQGPGQGQQGPGQGQQGPGKMERYQQMLKERDDAIKEAKAEMNSLKERFKNMENLRVEEKSQQSSATKEQDVAVRHLHNTLNQQSADIHRLRDDLFVAKGNVSIAQKEKAEIANELQLKIDETAELQKEISDLRDRVTSEAQRHMHAGGAGGGFSSTDISVDHGLTSQVDYSHQVTARDSSIDAMKQQVSELQQKCDNLEAEKARWRQLEERVQLAEKQKLEAVTERQMLATVLADTHHQCDELMAAKSALEKSLSEEKGLCEKLSDDMKALDTEMKTLAKENAVSQRHRTHFQQRLEKASVRQEEQKTQLIQLQNVLQVSEEQKHKVEKKWDVTSKKLEQMKLLFQELSQEREKIREQFLRLTKEEESWKKENEHNKKTINALQVSMVAENQKVTAFTGEKKILQQEVASLNQNVAMLLSEAERLKASHQTTLDRLAEEKRILEESLREASGRVSELKVHADHWVSEHQKVSDDYYELRQQMESNIRQSNTLKQERDEYRRNWTNTTSRLESMTQHLKHITEEKDSVKTALKHITDEKDSAKTALKARIDELAAETVALEENCKTSESKVHALVEHRDIMLAELESCKAKVEAYRHDYEEEHSAKDKLRVVNAGLTRERENCMQECELLKKSNNQLRSEVDELKTDQRIADIRRRAVQKTTSAAATATSPLPTVDYVPPQPQRSENLVPPRVNAGFDIGSGVGVGVGRGVQNGGNGVGSGVGRGVGSGVGRGVGSGVGRGITSRQAAAAASTQQGGGVFRQNDMMEPNPSSTAGGSTAVAGGPQQVPLEQPTPDGRFHMNIPPVKSPEYTCPKCASDYPDLNSLQMHVLDCIR